MKRLVHSLRSQSIGVLALFVALGGTGYAAISIPRNSVGTRQLRNAAVTASKLGKGSVTSRKLAAGSITSAQLDGRSIAGYVAFWARIDQAGTVLSSSVPATTNDWSTGLAAITFRGHLPSNCFALANSDAPPPFGYVNAIVGAGAPGQETVQVFMAPVGAMQSGPLPIAVAVICP